MQPFKLFFHIHVKGEKNINPTKKMNKIKTFQNKVQIWSFKNPKLFASFFFLNNFFHSLFFSIMYHTLSRYKKYWDEIITKKCIWMLMQNQKYSPNVHFKSPLLYDWCMFIEFHPSINIFIQVENLYSYIFLSNW